MENRNIGHIVNFNFNYIILYFIIKKAACENKINIIKFLKNTVRFDFKAKDNKNRTPLDDAIFFKHQEIVEIISAIL